MRVPRAAIAAAAIAMSWVLISKLSTSHLEWLLPIKFDLDGDNDVELIELVASMMGSVAGQVMYAVDASSRAIANLALLLCAGVGILILHALVGAVQSRIIATFLE